MPPDKHIYYNILSQNSTLFNSKIEITFFSCLFSCRKFKPFLVYFDDKITSAISSAVRFNKICLYNTDKQRSPAIIFLIKKKTVLPVNRITPRKFINVQDIYGSAPCPSLPNRPHRQGTRCGGVPRGEVFLQADYRVLPLCSFRKCA